MPSTHCYFDAQGILHHNSGKDLIASLVVAYVAYIILNMKGDPAAFFGLMPGTTLYIVNVAPTERQARTIFFQYLKHHLMSPLFAPFLREGGVILADEIRFPQKSLMLLSLHSRSASLEGYNILLWVMDEADDFVTTETGGSNAERIHKIFRSSSSTRLQNRSLGIVISYPRTEDGFMMGLETWFKVEWELRGVASGLYFNRASTWEVRPEIDKETNSIIQADYRNDPSLAAAMYECLDGDTMVVDECGLVPIREAKNRLERGVKETYKLQTRYGYEVVATSNHRMLLPDRTWAEVGALKVGDAIAIIQSPQPFGNDEWNLDLAELTGQLIADGHVSVGKQRSGVLAHTVAWAYDPQDEDLIERHMKMLQNNNLSPKLRNSSRVAQIRLRTRDAYTLFHCTMQVSPDKAWDKRVPKWVFTAKKEAVVAFLRGLFEGDGSINVRGVIDLTFASYGLVQDVQLLLGMFGITAKITSKAAEYNKTWNVTSKPCWHLSLSQRRAIKFWQEIGFLSARKQARCHRYNPDREYAFVSDLEHFPDTIVSIEPAGERETYDLFDRPGHRFFANGFVAHNCRPMPTEGAFFEFPEKLNDAIEKNRAPCAIVTEEIVIIPLQDGSERKYISGIVESVRREPGCTYFLTGDGGLKGDSYALSVFHIDETSNAFQYLCEQCAVLHPQMLQFAVYGQHREQTPPKVGVRCGVCQREPDSLAGMYGWFEKRGKDTQAELILNGRAFSIPHVYEDLLIEFQPKRRTPDNPEPILVHYPGVQEVCRELIVRLGVVRARFDPWMTAETLQGLQKSTGIDVGEISFSQPDQYRRARMAKALLYANLITLLPNQPKRDKEWRRLQRNGRKIDHPKGAGESKDLYDAESCAIWLAATYNFGVMELEWLSGL